MVDSSEGIGAWPKVCQARPRIRCRTGRRRGFLAGRFHTAWWGGPSLVEQAIDRNDDTSGLETGKASLCRLYCDSSRGVGGDNSRLQGSVKFKGAGYLTVFIRVNRNTSNTILVSEFGLHSSPNEVNQIARRSRRKSSDGAKVHVKAELCHNACNILLPIDAEAGYALTRTILKADVVVGWLAAVTVLPIFLEVKPVCAKGTQDSGRLGHGSNSFRCRPGNDEPLN